MIIKNIPQTISMNKYRNAHYFTLNDLKKEFVWLFLDRLIASGYTKSPLQTPISITFIFHYKDKRSLRDLDGNYPCVKFALDAMTGLGLIPDDNTEYVKRLTFETGEKIGNVFDMNIEKFS